MHSLPDDISNLTMGLSDRKPIVSQGASVDLFGAFEKDSK